ncbi:sensor histidine kinase [Actinomadura graeca]|uniref:histidine kinase n=1 Tax=Actinomadura graeca TaxID=2750812 RepID=A0ABX8QQP6_9ACTN|nr:histidine kinase [Actinomadura graeca]QXJ20958.1 sensor histidine kinase [Actinomadura graeca]
MDARWWRPDRPADRRWHWVALDVFVAYVSATIAIGDSDATASAFHGPPAVRAAAVVWFAAISGRRFAPATALWASAAATAATALTGHPLTNLSAASALALTMVAQTRPRPRAAAAAALPVAAALTALAAEGGGALVLGAVLHGGALLAGDAARSRREAAAALRAHEAGRAAALRRRALADERARMARELHDAVGHAVTVMVTHAGAARLSLGGGHEDVRRSLGSIEQVGRAALGDLDRVLGLLGDTGPPDLVAALRGLVSGLPPGLRADLVVDGDLPPVGEPAAQTLHRIVQESLTNVVRHASAATVRVQVSRDGEDVRVTVTDDGTAVPGPPGRGLAGMRERAGRLGGTCRAGPGPDGGWRVEARVPPATRAVT